LSSKASFAGFSNNNPKRFFFLNIKGSKDFFLNRLKGVKTVHIILPWKIWAN